MARTSTKNKVNASTVNFTEEFHPGCDPRMEQAQHADTDKMAFDMKGLFSAAGIELPSWKRLLVNALACFATGYLIGAVASVIINTMIAGVMALTGSVVVGWFFYILGLVIMVYAAFVAGRAVTQYIMSGSIDQDYAAVKAKVTGWFAKKPIVAAA